MRSDLHIFSVTCPACQIDVRVLADGVPPGTKVTCSRCGFDLGVWDELANGGLGPYAPIAPPEQEFHSWAAPGDAQAALGPRPAVDDVRG